LPLGFADPGRRRFRSGRFVRILLCALP
jgi:hypothetical protein